MNPVIEATNQVPEPTWKRVDVEIGTEKGLMRVDGLRHLALGAGLAVTHHPFGKFAVTHLKSGRKMSRKWERCVYAMHALLDLAPLADWTQDEDGIKAEAHRRAAAKELVPFGDSDSLIEYGFALAEARGTEYDDEFPWEESDPWESLEKRLRAEPSSSEPSNAL